MIVRRGKESSKSGKCRLADVVFDPPGIGLGRGAPVSLLVAFLTAAAGPH